MTLALGLAALVASAAFGFLYRKYRSTREDLYRMAALVALFAAGYLEREYHRRK